MITTLTQERYYLDIDPVTASEWNLWQTSAVDYPFAYITWYSNVSDGATYSRQAVNIVKWNIQTGIKAASAKHIIKDLGVDSLYGFTSPKISIGNGFLFISSSTTASDPKLLLKLDSNSLAVLKWSVLTGTASCYPVTDGTNCFLYRNSRHYILLNSNLKPTTYYTDGTSASQFADEAINRTVALDGNTFALGNSSVTPTRQILSKITVSGTSVSASTVVINIIEGGTSYPASLYEIVTDGTYLFVSVYASGNRYIVKLDQSLNVLATSPPLKGNSYEPRFAYLGKLYCTTGTETRWFDTATLAPSENYLIRSLTSHGKTIPIVGLGKIGMLYSYPLADRAAARVILGDVEPIPTSPTYATTLYYDDGTFNSDGSQSVFMMDRTSSDYGSENYYAEASGYNTALSEVEQILTDNSSSYTVYTESLTLNRDEHEMYLLRANITSISVGSPSIATLNVSSMFPDTTITAEWQGTGTASNLTFTETGEQDFLITDLQQKGPVSAYLTTGSWWTYSGGDSIEIEYVSQYPTDAVTRVTGKRYHYERFLDGRPTIDNLEHYLGGLPNLSGLGLLGGASGGGSGQHQYAEASLLYPNFGKETRYAEASLLPQYPNTTGGAYAEASQLYPNFGTTPQYAEYGIDTNINIDPTSQEAKIKRMIERKPWEGLGGL